MSDYPTGVTPDNATSPAVTTDYRFVQIPEDVLYDLALSPQAVRIYGALMRHGTSPTNCYPSHERLGTLLGVSERSIQRPMAELVKAGWIEKTKRFTSRGERTSDGYHVHTVRADLRVTSAQEVPVVQRAETSEEVEQLLNESNKPYVAAHGDDSDFEAFWRAYPKQRRIAKPEARKAFKEAVRKAPAEQIVAACMRYSSDPNRLDEFTPYPQKWLKQERWNAPPEVQRRQTSGAAPGAIDRAVERATARQAAGVPNFFEPRPQHQIAAGD